MGVKLAFCKSLGVGYIHVSVPLRGNGCETQGSTDADDTSLITLVLIASFRPLAG